MPILYELRLRTSIYSDCRSEAQSMKDFMYTTVAEAIGRSGRSNCKRQNN